MKRLLSVLTLLISCAVLSDALACRSMISEPLQLLTDPSPEHEVHEIFVGEIVAIRDIKRLERLRGCSPEEPLPATDDAGQPILNCVDYLGAHYQMEVYPLEVLHGAPSYPAQMTVTDCGAVPKVGSTAVVFHTTDGAAYIRVRRADEPDFHAIYEADYIDRVKRCLQGVCADD